MPAADPKVIELIARRIASGPPITAKVLQLTRALSSRDLERDALAVADDVCALEVRALNSDTIVSKSDHEQEDRLADALMRCEQQLVPLLELELLTIKLLRKGGILPADDQGAPPSTDDLVATLKGLVG